MSNDAFDHWTVDCTSAPQYGMERSSLDNFDSVVLKTDVLAGGYRNWKFQKFLTNHPQRPVGLRFYPRIAVDVRRLPVPTESRCDHAHFRYRGWHFQTLTAYNSHTPEEGNVRLGWWLGPGGRVGPGEGLWIRISGLCASWLGRYGGRNFELQNLITGYSQNGLSISNQIGGQSSQMLIRIIFLTWFEKN